MSSPVDATVCAVGHPPALGLLRGNTRGSRQSALEARSAQRMALPRAVLVLLQASHPPPRPPSASARSRFRPGATQVLLLRAEGQGPTSVWRPVSVTWFFSLLSQSREGLGILTQSLNFTSARPLASEASGPKARLFRGLVQCDSTSLGQRRPPGGVLPVNSSRITPCAFITLRPWARCPVWYAGWGWGLLSTPSKFQSQSGLLSAEHLKQDTLTCEHLAHATPNPHVPGAFQLPSWLTGAGQALQAFSLDGLPSPSRRQGLPRPVRATPAPLSKERLQPARCV